MKSKKLKNTRLQKIQSQKTYLTLLKEFVSFKTISTDLSFKKEMERAITWFLELFQKNKFDIKIIKGKNHNPVIIAKYVKNQSLKTFLVYGHYDVQPAHKDEGWKSEPFILRKEKGRAKSQICNG